MKKLRLLLPACLLFLLMLRADAAREAAVQGVELAVKVVFPSLFPFCVVTRQLTGAGGGGRQAFLMGLCGGYPLGVYALCSGYRAGGMTRQQAERLLLVCNNTGPAVFFGMAGALLFFSPMQCAALYLIHILSAVLIALLFGMGERTAPQPSAAPEPLTESIRQATVSTAILCGYVIFFTVLLRLLLRLPLMAGLLAALPISQAASTALLSAFADLSSGIRATAEVGRPYVRFLLCAAGASWGGVCVHMQAKSLWREAGLQPKGYLLAKTLQTAFSLALALPVARLAFGAPLPVWPAALPFVVVGMKKIIDSSGRSDIIKRNQGKNIAAELFTTNSAAEYTTLRKPKREKSF